MNRPATSPPQSDNVPITMIPLPSATCKCAPSHRVCDEFPRERFVEERVPHSFAFCANEWVRHIRTETQVTVKLGPPCLP